MLTIGYKDPVVRAYKNIILFNKAAYAKEKPKDKRTFTAAELKVLDFLLAGLSNSEIAGLLKVNKTTANARVKSILRYFGAIDQLDLLVGLIGDGYTCCQPARQKKAVK